MRLTSKILILALFPLVLGGSANLITSFISCKQALLQELEGCARIEHERRTEAIRGFFGKHVIGVTALSPIRVLQEGRLPGLLKQLRLWEPKFIDIETLHCSDRNGNHLIEIAP